MKDNNVNDTITDGIIVRRVGNDPAGQSDYVKLNDWLSISTATDPRDGERTLNDKLETSENTGVKKSTTLKFTTGGG